MYLNIFSWLFVAVAVIGTVLVTRRNPRGYWFWAVSNVGLIVTNLYKGGAAQTALFIVCLIVSLDGIRQERRRNRWRRQNYYGGW